MTLRVRSYSSERDQSNPNINININLNPNYLISCIRWMEFWVTNPQMSKVASALLSGKYSSTSPDAERPATKGDKNEKNEKADGGDDDLVVVAPRIFKQLVGHGHSEFSSGRQQDAAEYMQHLLEVGNRLFID